MPRPLMLSGEHAPVLEPREEEEEAMSLEAVNHQDITGNKQASWRLFAVAIALILLVSAGHYMTGVENVDFHNVYRRLYYVPVVLSAFAFGLRGGLFAALVVSLAYMPHAFFMAHHHDPAPAVDKVFEMILYFGVGGLTGWLVERERAIRRKLQNSLEERDALSKELVRAGKLSAMGELLSGVAHEVRNPLASIMGAAEALSRQVDEGGRAEKLVDLQLREIARLDRVVSSFLAFARTSEPQPVRCAISPLVEQVVELTRHHEREGEISISPLLKGEEIFADADQITQVLLNLTLNAMQAAGEQPFSIEFVHRETQVAAQHHTCIGVRDRGEGIEPEHLEQVFDPYYTTRDAGSGLGLSISSRLIEAHGGFIDVESVPGEETTFWICLPTGRERKRARRNTKHEP